MPQKSVAIFKKLLAFTKTRLLLLLLFVLIITGIYIYSQNNNKTAAIQFIEVKKQDLRSTVSASGVLTGKQTSDLKFLSSGKLSYINVELGDTVQNGQVVAGLDAQTLQIALQQARNTLVAKQAAAQKIEDEVKNHDTDESFEQKTKRTAAQTDSNNAYDGVKAAERNLQDAILVSPISGIVTQVNKSPGQSASLTDLIVQVVDQSKIFFDAEVDEADIDLIKEGQLAEVTLNSNPDKIYKGLVSQIYPNTKTTTSGATVVIVRIDLTGSGVRFINNLNGQATIITAEAKNVLSIPQEALKDENKVIVKNPNGFSEVKTETGLHSESDVEIKSGLTEGQMVVKNPEAVKK